MTRKRGTVPTSTAMVVLGTRPEAIKLAPVVNALYDHGEVGCAVLHTGQHSAVATDVLDAFGIEPDIRLDLLRPGQSLVDLLTRAVSEVALHLVRARPAIVVVQGDTTTAVAAAIAAAQLRIPVAHVEAGLRSGDRTAPFPEEDNRRLISVVSDLHFPPTAKARANLIAEGVDASLVTVTGNTGIDALDQVLARPHPLGSVAAEVRSHRGPVALVTMHRRESWGAPMAAAATGIRRLLDALPGLLVVLPMHPNSDVRVTIRAALGGHPRALLCEPLPFADMAEVLSASTIVLTDSGGLQEEAPRLGVPVLVLRETTERPEGVDVGIARLVGTEPDRIVHEGLTALQNPVDATIIEQARRLYGDGLASRRCVAAIVRRVLGHSAATQDDVIPAFA